MSAIFFPFVTAYAPGFVGLPSLFHIHITITYLSDIQTINSSFQFELVPVFTIQLVLTPFGPTRTFLMFVRDSCENSAFIVFSSGFLNVPEKATGISCT